MSLETVLPTADHERFMVESKALLRKFEHLDSMVLLALASQLVGNLIALQDQRKVTSAMAMELVIRNIQEGNEVAIVSLVGAPEGSA